MTRKNRSNFALRLYVLLMLELLYFLWQPFPRSILLRSCRGDAGWGGVVTNLLFLALQYPILKRIFTTGEKGHAWRDVLGFLLTVGVQLGCDAALLAAFDKRYTLFPFVSYGCAIAQWVLWVCILWRLYPDAERPVTRKRASLCALVVLAVLGLFALLGVGQIKQAAYLLAKYKDTSMRLSGKLINIHFRQELRSGLLGLITACCLCWIRFYGRQEESEEERPRVHYIGKWLVRAYLIFLAVLALHFGKLIVLPEDTFLDFHFAEYGRISYVEKVDHYDFYPWCEEAQAYRIAQDGEFDIVYSRTVCKVSSKGPEGDLSGGHSFLYDGRYPNVNGLSWGVEYLNAFDAAVFVEEVVWVEDSVMQHVGMREIKEQEKNRTLIQICQDRIKNGDWDFFEYAGEYLLWYAPAFIQPYIDRYAAGEFTEEELNKEIKSSYIQEIAQGLSEIDRTPPRPAENRRASDGSSLPDKSLLYKQLITPERERSDELELSVTLKDREASFYPREGAESAESQNLLPAEIYSKSVTVDLEKGGKLILGCDSDESSPILYLNPRVVKEDDPEGTQYGFFMPYGFEYMFSNPPKYGYPISVFLRLDDFHSLEVYDAKGEPLAQYDNHTKQFVMFPDKEWESMPGTNFFINNRSYDFIPCDGGVRFGPCYFHHAEDSEPLPIPPEKGGVLCFQTQMAIVRLSDGEVLDKVFILLREVEFNEFELAAVSETALVPVK